MPYRNTRFKLIDGNNEFILNASEAESKMTGFCLICNENVRVHNGPMIEPHVEHFEGEGQSCPLSMTNKKRNKKTA